MKNSEHVPLTDDQLIELRAIANFDPSPHMHLLLDEIELQKAARAKLSDSRGEICNKLNAEIADLRARNQLLEPSASHTTIIAINEIARYRRALRDLLEVRNLPEAARLIAAEALRK